MCQTEVIKLEWLRFADLHLAHARGLLRKYFMHRVLFELQQQKKVHSNKSIQLISTFKKSSIRLIYDVVGAAYADQHGRDLNPREIR
jgi:hypothetical protein